MLPISICVTEKSAIEPEITLNNNTKVEASLIHFPPLLEYEQTEITELVS